MPLRRILTCSWLPALTAAIVITLILVHFGMPAGVLPRLVAYFVLTVCLPGVFVWRGLMREVHTDAEQPATWFEDLAIGTIFGFGVQLPVYLLGVWIHQPRLFWLIPIVLVVATVVSKGARGIWTQPSAKVDFKLSWAIAAIPVFGVGWLARNMFSLQPLGLPRGDAPFVDESFHQSLIGELMYRFPPQIPYLHDTPLDYHWFVHAQMAATVWGTGIDTRVLLRLVMPALMISLTAAGLGAVALRLTKRPFTAFLAPALMFAGGFNLIGPHYQISDFSEPYMMKRLVFSPSQTYGFAIALPVILLLLEVLRPDRKARRSTWIALTVSLFALSGAKATFLPIFLCGMAGVWLFQIVFARTFDKTATALLVLVAAVTAFAQFILLGGASGGLTFMFWGTVDNALHAEAIARSPASIVFMTTTMLIGWLLYSAGAIGLVVRSRWRDRRAVWMLVTIITGVAVPFLLERPGWAQLWFQRSVAELVVLLSVWGLSLLLPTTLPRRDGVVLGSLAGGAGLAGFLVASYIESNRTEVNLASYDTLIYTTVAPIAVVVCFVLVRQGAKIARPAFRPRVEMLAVLLIGLGFMHVYSLAYDSVSQRPLPPPATGHLFAAGGYSAARWVANHSSPDTLIATNVHCAEPTGPCDNRNFWISGYSRRRVLIEGWGYTSVTTADRPAGAGSRGVASPYPHLLAMNDAAFEHPSATTVGRLVRRYGVRWLFVSKKYRANLSGLKALPGVLGERFHNQNYVVFEVLDAH
ncbi:MAG: hypothetical protein ACRDPG_10145 [Nocardioidaceae bacterium]